MTAWVRYLYHSGFLVETDLHFFIFDYWKMKPENGGLAQGVIRPEELWGKEVVFLVSHKHADHYNPRILKLKNSIPNSRLIVSNDISPIDGAVMIGPKKALHERDFSLQTLTSTDEGVAFLLETDGLRIFHSGDLNWWKWEGESEEENSKMERDFQAQIKLLGQAQIDLAFMPVDPRLGKNSFLGIDYLMRTTNVRKVVPMHFADDASVVGKLISNPLTEPYRDKILPLTRRGDRMDFFREVNSNVNA